MNHVEQLKPEVYIHCFKKHMTIFHGSDIKSEQTFLVLCQWGLAKKKLFAKCQNNEREFSGFSCSSFLSTRQLVILTLFSFQTFREGDVTYLRELLSPPCDNHVKQTFTDVCSHCRLDSLTGKCWPPSDRMLLRLPPCWENKSLLSEFSCNSRDRVAGA